MKAPRIILICCEGKTEALYCEILARHFRLPQARMRIIGGQGQHKVLVDRTVDERTKLISEVDLRDDEIMSWAVCDDDNMAISYKELHNYAQAKNVRLAFSRPQFEAFLLQHFEQSKETNREILFKRLDHYKAEYSDTMPDSSSMKTDLEWLERAIFMKPKLIDIAITNAKQRTRQSSMLFLTMHKLVESLQRFAAK